MISEFVPIELKRLVTIESDRLSYIYRNCEGYEIKFDREQIYSLTKGLILSDSEKELLDKGSRLKVAYWIESSPDE